MLKISKVKFSFIAFIMLLNFNHNAYSMNFGERLSYDILKDSDIDEASGLIVSPINKGIYWTHNDGRDGVIYGINHQGETVARLVLDKSILLSDSDIEDIAQEWRKENNENYIYLADIGDNSAKRKSIFIYRIKEPKLEIDKKIYNFGVKDIEKAELEYPNGSRDAETLLFDPITKDLLIVSKRESNVGVYKISKIEYENCFLTQEKITMTQLATLPIGRIQEVEGTGITGGDISFDGSEILLRDYTSIYYYKRNGNETLKEVFSKNEPLVVKQFGLAEWMQIEPQGEAIAWNLNSSGFYTISEIRFNVLPRLFFFQRIAESVQKSPEISEKDIYLVNNNNKLNVYFDIKQAGFYDIEVIDINGNKVGKYDRKFYVVGKHSEKIKSKKFANGTYFVLIKGDNNVLKDKFIFSK